MPPLIVPADLGRRPNAHLTGGNELWTIADANPASPKLVASRPGASAFGRFLFLTRHSVPLFFVGLKIAGLRAVAPKSKPSRSQLR